MDSRELGLLLAQQIFKVDDLHYGLWDEGEVPTMAALPGAQQRYNDFLLERLTGLPRGARVLDIGCGVGKLLTLLAGRGFVAEGVNPSPTMCRMVRERLERHGYPPTAVYECKFEDFPATERLQLYDAAIFSESFQYIPMNQSLALVRRIVKPGGLVMICDFFKTAAHGDGGEGDGTFGGGHPLAAFAPALAQANLQVIEDLDITSRVSPNIALVDDMLVGRAQPAAATIGRYLDERYPTFSSIGRWLLRKKLAKVQRKYLSGHRNPRVFERYKNYRLTVCRVG
jgi:SAM-dependent methyltransferase